MENPYFRKALSDFTYEVASGGAIRHLTDLGYTVRQIMEQLDFPTPYERVQKEVWERLKETGIILPEEPGRGGRKERFAYVQERDRFGRTSFRRVTQELAEDPVTDWKEQVLWIESASNAGGIAGRESIVKGIPDRERVGRGIAGSGNDGGRERMLTGDGVFAILQEKVGENGEKYAYVSCDFGCIAGKKPEQYLELLSALEGTGREYVEGLSWERHRVYHRMNSRMMEVLEQLCRAGLFQGECFFLKTQEKIEVKRT